MHDVGEGVFRLSLTGPGVEVSREIDEERAGRVLAVVLGTPGMDGGRVPRSTSRPGEADPAEPVGSGRIPRIAPREVLDNSSATQNAEKVMVLGWYLVEQEGFSDFSLADIKSTFQRARERVPTNLPRDLQSAVKKGWIAEVPGKRGRYYVTRKGEDQAKRTTA